MKHEFTLDDTVKGHFFLLDKSKKDVLKSNGYVSKKATLDAAKKVFVKGGKFKGKKIVKSEETKTGWLVVTA